MKHFLTIWTWMFTITLFAAEPAASKAGPDEQTASGTFVSFKDGTLTIKGKSTLFVYHRVGTSYQTFENNESGPGCKQVDTVAALGQVLPGTALQVNVADREIFFGLGHRVIGAFESYKDGKLNLLAADVAPGFIKKPAGVVVMTIDPGIPVLESINGGDFQPAGPAGKILQTVKKGTVLTARSEYDAGNIEVIKIGEPKRRMERYAGQTTGTLRGTFVSFKDHVLRIRGKGVTSLAANQYDGLFNLRIADSIPIVESIDGGAHKPARTDALETVKEGMIVMIRRIEGVILEIQIGVAKEN